MDISHDVVVGPSTSSVPVTVEAAPGDNQQPIAVISSPDFTGEHEALVVVTAPTPAGQPPPAMVLVPSTPELPPVNIHVEPAEGGGSKVTVDQTGEVPGGSVPLATITGPEGSINHVVTITAPTPQGTQPAPHWLKASHDLVHPQILAVRPVWHVESQPDAAAAPPAADLPAKVAGPSPSESPPAAQRDAAIAEVAAEPVPSR